MFSINTDGSDFTVLHSFDVGDGYAPWGNLAIHADGSTLYGTTSSGGENGDGEVFGLGTNGQAFDILHSFDGFDGSEPISGLVLSGSTLYGKTVGGGANNSGAVFSINTDGPVSPFSLRLVYILPASRQTRR